MPQLFIFAPDAREPLAAEFSECRRYRYTLRRRWGEADHWLNFLLLNPSTADELTNDPTVERCERRARLWGYGGLVVTNLFAFRSTDPGRMKRAVDPVGPENDRHILEMALAARKVVCGWGAHGRHQGRSAAVVRMLREAEVPLFALAFTANKQPQHPLYLPYSLEPMPMVPK